MFFKACANGEYVNLASCIILLWSEGNISPNVKYLHLSIFPDGNADVLPAALLILYYNVSSLILSSVVVISF